MPKYNPGDTPYWEEVAGDIDNPVIEEIDVLKSAQIGWTRFTGAVFGYWGDTTSETIMLGLPTDEKALHEQREKFEPWLKEVEGLVRSARRWCIKFARGGTLLIRSFEKSKAIKSDACRFITADEVDEAPENVEGEGDPLKMMEARQIAQRWPKKLFGSTPKDAQGHIAKRDALAGEKREMWGNCPHCRKPQRLVWEQVKWAKVEGATHREQAAIIATTPGMVWYECLNGCRIKESERLPFITAARWVSQTEKADKQGNITITQVQTLDESGKVVGKRPLTTSVSYRPWSIISTWFSWSKLVKVWLEACDDPAARKSVLSQYMGRLPRIQEIKAVSIDGMTRTQQEAKRATGKPGILPTWTAKVIAGVDVQGDRFYWVIRAFGRVQSQLIAAGVCGTFAEVRALLDRKFPVDGTAIVMGVDALAIDFGGTRDASTKDTAKEKVFDFAGADPRIMPTKGHANESRDDFKVSIEPAYRRDFMAVHSIRIADTIFELRTAGIWHLFQGVDSSYVASIDSVKPTLSEAGERGYAYGERCDWWDAEVYAYCLFRHLSAKEQIPDEVVLERMRKQSSTDAGQSFREVLSGMAKKPQKKW